MKTKGQNTTQKFLKITKLHFVYAFVLAISVGVYHASNLIPPESVLDRWILIVGLVIVSTSAWALIKTFPTNKKLINASTWGLVIYDILLAGFFVYFERGMASLAVALFIIPLVSIMSLGNKVYIYAVAGLSTAVYSLACMKYFVDFFNEGYKVQLYSTIGLYAAVYFIIAVVLSTNLSKNK